MFWGLSVGRGIDCVVVFNNFPINCTIRSRSQFSDCRKMCFTIKGKCNNNIEAAIFAEENTPYVKPLRFKKHCVTNIDFSGHRNNFD